MITGPLVFPRPGDHERRRQAQALRNRHPGSLNGYAVSDGVLRNLAPTPLAALTPEGGAVLAIIDQRSASHCPVKVNRRVHPFLERKGTGILCLYQQLLRIDQRA